jgi:hypothetical protein
VAIISYCLTWSKTDHLRIYFFSAEGDGPFSFLLGFPFGHRQFSPLQYLTLTWFVFPALSFMVLHSQVHISKTAVLDYHQQLFKSMRDKKPLGWWTFWALKAECVSSLEIVWGEMGLPEVADLRFREALKNIWRSRSTENLYRNGGLDINSYVTEYVCLGLPTVLSI